MRNQFLALRRLCVVFFRTDCRKRIYGRHEVAALLVFFWVGRKRKVLISVDDMKTGKTGDVEGETFAPEIATAVSLSSVL